MMFDSNENFRILSAKSETLNAASTLTVLRDTSDSSPLIPLRAFCEALRAGDINRAKTECFSFTAALLNCSARRVSGNILLDYILDLLLMHDHPFAKAAARGCADEALFNAVRNDLAVLQALSGAGEKLPAELINARAGEIAKRGSPPDHYERLSSAAWGGSVPAPAKPHDFYPVPDFSPFDMPFSWNYGEFALRDGYFADEALEEMYKRILKSEDWSLLADELWNFFSTCGSGQFLKYRNFYYDGKLRPLPALRTSDFVSLFDDEYKSLLNNAIAFMRDDSAKPMLLYGAEGMGKTTMMLELTDELPRLRLIYVIRGRERLPKLLALLKEQPLKFMVLMDDLEASELRGICEPLLPTNVLLAACSEKRILPSLFEISINLPNPPLNETIQLVSKLLKYRSEEMPRDIIHRACIDYQVDTKSEFSIISVIRIADMLLS